jgi:hypothetical protein
MTLSTSSAPDRQHSVCREMRIHVPAHTLQSAGSHRRGGKPRPAETAWREARIGQPVSTFPLDHAPRSYGPSRDNAKWSNSRKCFKLFPAPAFHSRWAQDAVTRRLSVSDSARLCDLDSAGHWQRLRQPPSQALSTPARPGNRDAGPGRVRWLDASEQQS